MKLTKKLLALALVLAMVLAMAVTVSAANITISGTSGCVYTVYKMYDVVTLDGSEVYKPVSGWDAFVSYATVGNYLQKNVDYVSVKNGVTLTESDKAALAQLAKAYVQENASSLTELGTVTADTTGNTIAVDNNGYYLLMATTGQNALVKIGTENRTINDKNPVGGGGVVGVPYVTKQVQEDSNSSWGAANTADIGQQINFKTVITTETGATNYVLHDKVDAAITLNNNIVVQFVDGHGTVATTDDDDPTTVESTEYEVKTDGLTDDCTFHIVFKQSYLDTLKNYDSLVVTYSGYLNENATVETACKNTAWLTYTNANTETTPVSTETTTYEVVVEKKGNNGVALKGAEFVLMNSADKYYQLGVGNKVSWVDSIDDATKKVSALSGEKALLSFVGVDEAAYTLVETKAPTGYVTPTDDAAKTSVNAGASYVNDVTTITNTLGAALPETGGMGTTIFYVVGGILVLAAVALLATKKRSASK